jgi:hypothetical protein
MDPSQTQEDKSNDVQALSNGASDDNNNAPAEATTNTTDDGKTAITDTTGGGGESPKAKKESALKKFWRKFNIYLLMFIFVVMIAVAIVVFMTYKAKQDTQKTIAAQQLTQDALKQLSNTDVTVGDAKQVLTVQSNAVFAGSVLIKSALEVAGNLQVGGGLKLTSLQVSDSSQLSDTTVNNLTVSGTLNLQGALTIKNGINVTGNSGFAGNVTTTSLTTGQLQLNGDLNITSHISAGGTTPSASRGTGVGGGGTISLTGSDTAGSISINTGSSPPAGCFASVTFTKKFNSTPHVNITPIGVGAAGLGYYVDRTTTGFSICTATPAPAASNFGFDYIIFD